MVVVVCERGCGRTSLDPDSQIEKFAIRARQNGSEDSVYDGSIEACKACRESLHNTLIGLFTPRPMSVTVKVEDNESSQVR